MSFYNVDDSKCTRCGRCAGLCPVGIISLVGDDVPRVSQAQAVTCIKCGQCVVFCPTRANSLAFQDDAELIRAQDLAMPETDCALNLLKTRRSVRCFKSEAVTEKDFSRLFDTVSMAPTAGNNQTVRWIVTQNREKTEEVENLMRCWLHGGLFNEPVGLRQRYTRARRCRLRGILFNEPASHMGIIAARFLAKVKAGEDMSLYGAPNLIIAVLPKSYDCSEDGVIAMTYIELAAHAMGLGCCWSGLLTTALREDKPLRKCLGISEDEQICGAQMIGYPAYEPARQFPPRKTPTISWLR